MRSLFFCVLIRYCLVNSDHDRSCLDDSVGFFSDLKTEIFDRIHGDVSNLFIAVYVDRHDAVDSAFFNVDDSPL